MSRLPALKPGEMVKALKKAGFVEDHQKGSHLYLRQSATGRTTAVPTHPGDLKRPLMKKIIRDAGLAEEEFRQLL